MDVLDIVCSIINEGEFEPRYNISPSEPPLPAGSLVGDEAIWPLLPVWARGDVPKYSNANARSEELANKAA